MIFSVDATSAAEWHRATKNASNIHTVLDRFRAVKRSVLEQALSEISPEMSFL